MPVLTIDGRKIETQPGKTIIEAALDNGVTIPHFCWHPALSVAGNCRMCLVNVGSQKKNPEGQLEFNADGSPTVNWMPKLQIACATPVSEGMIVTTSDKKSVDASNAVMEFLLINHPLDCPICDEAGQCKLQEYAYKYSKGESRFDDVKNHKDKRVQWGPNVMFDGERCISCSRCIRYANEVAHQPVLSFVQRGDHVTIQTFEGTEFDSPYSMNVIELCPVGALTSVDFRFKARVWDMSFNDSICPGCARGCNVQIGVRNNEIERLEPRTNPNVNQYWMCDSGRLNSYRWVNDNRVSGAYVRSSNGLNEVSWEDAVAQIAANLSRYDSEEVMIVLGGMVSNEDAFLARRLATEVIKTKNLVSVRRTDNRFADDFLRVSDRSPNTNGIEAVGVENIIDPSEIISCINARQTKALIVIGDELIRGDQGIRAVIEGLPFFALATFNYYESADIAHVILGLSTYAESEGSYTNCNKRVQHFEPAVVTKENMRIMGMKMSRLDKFGSHNDRWTQGAVRESRQGWQIIQSIANARNAGWSYKNSRQVFADLSDAVPSFGAMSYDLLDKCLGVELSKAVEAESVGVIYESHFMKPN